MMTVNIVTMMRLLSGMIVIKNAKTKGPESKNKRRVNAYYLAFIKMVGLVYLRRREK